MIIDNFYINSTIFMPNEANTPLIIYPNAVLPTPVTFKLLQAISWWNT